MERRPSAAIVVSAGMIELLRTQLSRSLGLHRRDVDRTFENNCATLAIITASSHL